MITLSCASLTIEVGQSLNITLDLQSYGSQATLQQINGSCLPNWLHWLPIVQNRGHLNMGPQNRFRVINGWAYYADGDSNSILLVNVTDPQNPRIVQNYYMSGTPVGLDLMEPSFLVVAHWGSKVKVINISNPLAPFIVSCCVGGDYLNDVAVHGSWAYVGNSGGDIDIIDFSNVTAPILVRQVSTQSVPIRVMVQGTSLYVLEQNGFQIGDLSDPSNITWKANWPLFGQPMDLMVTGHQLAVITTTVFQLIETTTMTLLVNLSLSGTGVALNGPWAYFVDGHQLRRVDLRQWSSPMIQQLRIDNNTQLTTEGLLIYTQGSQGLHIYDVSQFALWGTPVAQETGQYLIQITGHNRSSNLTVNVVETAPPIVTLWIHNQTTGVGQFYNCTVANAFSNQYQEPMTYTLTIIGPADKSWLQWNPLTQMITGIPPRTMDLWLQATATNPKCCLSVAQNWTVHVVSTLISMIQTHLINYRPTIAHLIGGVSASSPSPTLTTRLILVPSHLGHLSTETIGGVTSTYNQSTGVWQASGLKDYVNALTQLVTFQSMTEAQENGTIQINITDSFNQIIIDSMTLILNQTQSSQPPLPPSSSSSWLWSRSRSSSTKARTTTWVGIVGGVVGGTALAMIGFSGVILWRIHRYRSKQKMLFNRPTTNREVPLTETMRIDPSKVTRIKSKDLELGCILGQGGFGTVYKGIWKSGGDILVAVKKLNPGCETMTDILQSFEKEVDLMSGFRHPNIIQIYGISCDDGSGPLYSIVMEFMAGGSLESFLYHLDQDLPWDPLLWQMIDDCASGLIYLHGRGIMHRDIKSANVLLDGNRRAKWTDFGISRVIDEQQKTMTKCQGTVPWMAPEIIRGETHYTMKADVYSFGLLLWEFVARQQPFKEMSNQFKIYERILAGGRPTLPEKTPPILTEVIQWCWQGEAEARPMMDQVRQRINEGLGRSPLLHHPSPILTPSEESLSPPQDTLPAPAPAPNPHRLSAHLDPPKGD